MNKEEESKQSGILSVAHHDFEKGMNKYSFFKISNHSTSDDLVQDTFVKTWKYMLRGGKIVIMKSFLYHVLNGLIVDEYRKKKPLSLDSLIENGYEPRNDSNEQNMKILDGKTAIALIKNIPEKYQKVIKMKYVQDLSLKEMSLITGKTKNTLAVQIHRGIEMLKILYNHS